MGARVWKISQIVTDTCMLIIVGAATPIIKKTNNIFKRGFFCNDEDLMHPLTPPSSIDSGFFHPLWCLLGILTILIIEYLGARNKPEKIHLWKFKLPIWFYNTYCILLAFLFGALSTVLIGTVLKGTVGRLRPVFLTECVPNVNCSLPENQHVYHTNYECTNDKFKENTRLSFPSGHASFSMYCALFLAVHVQTRVNCVLSKLTKCALEVALILTAFYVGASRVSDYKHFWGDVLGGFLTGAVCAAVVSLSLYAPLVGNGAKRRSNSVLPYLESNCLNKLNFVG